MHTHFPIQSMLALATLGNLMTAAVFYGTKIPGYINGLEKAGVI